jgi:hypothetical protein
MRGIAVSGTMKYHSEWYHPDAKNCGNGSSSLPSKQDRMENLSVKPIVVSLILLVGSVVVLTRLHASDAKHSSRPNERAAQKVRSVSSQTASNRALCLASLVLRAQTEYKLHPDPDDLPSTTNDVDRDFAVRQEDWMKQVGLWEAASARERALLEKPLGTWKRQDVADGQWREETLALLMWAFQSGTVLPPYDEPAFKTEIMKTVPHPSASLDFIANAKLRDSSEIADARDTAELWLWRARTTQLQRDHTKAPQGMTFQGIVAMTAKAAQAQGLFTAIDSNFPALGKSYAKLSEPDWQTMRSIATERLYGLNWLCGYAEDWDDVPTST